MKKSLFNVAHEHWGLKHVVQAHAIHVHVLCAILKTVAVLRAKACLLIVTAAK